MLHALGYAYIPGGLRGERFIKTGLISVATSPPGAAVDLGGRRQPLLTPAVLRNLKPGDYTLTLSLSGHRPWAGRVTVEAERAAALEKVLLLPEPPDVRVVDSGPFRSLRPLTGTPYVLVFRGPTLREVAVTDARTEEMRPLFSPDSVFARAKLQHLYSVEGSDRLFLVARSEGRTRYLWARLEREETRVADITHLFPEPPSEPQWDPGRPEEIFFEANGHLSRVHPESAAVYPEFMNGLRGYGLAGGRILALQRDGSFVRADRDGTNVDAASEAPPPSALLDGAGGRFRIEETARGSFLFRSDTGALLTNVHPYELVPRGVAGTATEQHSKKTLFWTNREIAWIGWGAEAQGAGPHRIIGGGRRIAQAAWVHQGSHVLFTDRGRAYLVETGVPGKPRILELFESRAGGAFAWIEEEGSVFHLDKKGALVRLRLVRRPTILPMPKTGSA